MSHDLDRRAGQDDERSWDRLTRPLRDEPKPRFGRYLGLINARD